MVPCLTCGHAFERKTGDTDFCPSCGVVVDDAELRWQELDRVVAFQKARPPAVGLMIVGSIVLLSGVAGPALLGAMLVTEGLPPAGEEQTLMLGVMAGVAVSGLAALAVGGFVVFGGYRMFGLRSWNVAVAASVLASVSTIGCCVAGFFGLPGLAGLPVGIWSLVVLNDPIVRTAFR